MKLSETRLSTLLCVCIVDIGKCLNSRMCSVNCHLGLGVCFHIRLIVCSTDKVPTIVESIQQDCI